LITTTATFLPVEVQLRRNACNKRSGSLAQSARDLTDKDYIRVYRIFTPFKRSAALVTSATINPYNFPRHFLYFPKT